MRLDQPATPIALRSPAGRWLQSNLAIAMIRIRGKSAPRHAHSAQSSNGIEVIRDVLCVMLAIALFFNLSGALLAAGTTSTISGTVTDGMTSVPLVNVKVTALSSSGSVEVLTDAKGHYSIIGLRPDTYTVTFELRGFEMVSIVDVTVLPDQNDNVSEKMERNLATIGRVVVKPFPKVSSTPYIPPPVGSENGVPSGKSPEEYDYIKLRRPNYVIQRVFFATDRGVACKKCIPLVSFDGEQSGRNELRYGEADVSIPCTHVQGDLESPSLWKLEFRPDKEKHIVLVSSRIEPRADFENALRVSVARSTKKDAFIFIHGYNVTFNDALRRTAQLAHDLKIFGPAITYSWPAKGEFLDYAHDETNIAWTTPHLEKLLASVATVPGIASVHIIAHSMGNRAVAEALALFGDKYGRLAHLSDVVLAAPDIDVGRFEELATAFRKSVPYVTIYASASDHALQLSHRFHGSQRVGDVSPSPVVFPGFDVVDVTSVDTDWLGHGYFSNSALMGDISNIFLGVKMPRFGIEQRSDEQGNPYWYFVKRH